MSPSVVVLAAGKGERMKSSLPKVFFPIAGVQALRLVLRTIQRLKPLQITLVVSPAMKECVESIVKDETKGSRAKVNIAYQKSHQGTAGSLLAARKHWATGSEPVLVLNGDMPLVTEKTLKSLIDFHKESNPDATMVTVSLQDPTGYGRVIRGHSGNITEIVEEVEAAGRVRDITEVNAGCYLFDPKILKELLHKIKPSKKGELYLTDLISEVVKSGKTIKTFAGTNPKEFYGMNSRKQHSELCKIMQHQINDSWMDRGVSILSPETTWIDLDVKIGPDVLISSNVHLVGKTIIGTGVVIEPNSIIRKSTIEDGCWIKAGSYIEESLIKKNAHVGPYARIRPESKIGVGSRVGNFVELKKTILGDGSKANHLSYIGDATIGKESNIGAGVITCNYDGGLKYQGKAKTIVGNHAFIGSDVQLIAPIKISDHAYVASGSSITTDVPPYALAISRARQENKKNFIRKLQKRKQRENAK